MEIINCDRSDLGLLTRFYDWGRELQQQRSARHWKQFEPETINREIDEGRQWKMVAGEEVIAVFLTAYEDPFIWGDKGIEPAVYLHRIVTNPDHRGKGVMRDIIAWTRMHAKERGISYLRMDTWGDNPVLLNYYMKHGFKLLGVVTPDNTESLPAHYDCISLGLLEMEIK